MPKALHGGKGYVKKALLGSVRHLSPRQSVSEEEKPRRIDGAREHTTRVREILRENVATGSLGS